jgi:predicted enzyme related to lactoylglutathione lyase
MANPVVHFEIGAKDRKKSEQFYSDLFGWQIKTYEGMDYGLVDPAGDKSIGGGIGPTPPGGGPYVTFYVLVDDLQASLDKAEKLGGKTVLPPTPIPGYGSSAMFTDPDGNLIGLFKGNM